MDLARLCDYTRDGGNRMGAKEEVNKYGAVRFAIDCKLVGGASKGGNVLMDPVDGSVLTSVSVRS